MTIPNIPDLMTVHEVSEYLRIRERTIYELVRTCRIPFTRLSGRLLFPRRLIELWVAESSEFPRSALHLVAPPPVIAGSHDPLLEWSLREAECGLALLGGGSADGLVRLAEGQAVACGVHIVDPESGKYDAVVATSGLRGVDYVVIEWARREQGLITAKSNPKQIQDIGDLIQSGVRLAARQEGSGSASLLDHLLRLQGIEPDAVKSLERPARTELDVATMIRDGEADVGLAVRAAATAMDLRFIPIVWERFDLVVRRIEYFEAPFQKLLDLTRDDRFQRKADGLTGYDVSGVGRVVLNPR